MAVRPLYRLYIMKIRIKWYASLFFLLAAGFGFVSCSEDDDKFTQVIIDDNGGNGKTDGGDVGNDEGKPDVETPDIGGAGIEYPVMAFAGEYKFGSYYSDAAFTYDSQGRMTAYHCEGLDCTFSYEPWSISEVISYSGTRAVYDNIKLDANGFVVSCDNRWYEDGDAVDEDVIRATFEYDEEGHLLCEKGVAVNDDTESWTITYTWEDGNLVKVESVESYEFDGRPMKDYETLEYTYDTDKYPNANIYFYADTEAGTGSLFFEFPCCFYAGLLGRASKNIPVGWTDTMKFGDEPSSSSSHAVTSVVYNGDGSVREIHCTTGDDTFTFYYGYAKFPIPDTSVSYYVAPQIGVKGLKRHRTGLYK